MKDKNLVLLTGWISQRNGDSYSLPDTHARYVNYLSTKYNKVTVICRHSSSVLSTSKKQIELLDNINFVNLPNYTTHVSAILKAVPFLATVYKGMRGADVIYSRIPDPFFWLIYFFRNKEQRLIFHFVGDPVEVLALSKGISSFVKRLVYRFELYLLEKFISSKDYSQIYCNGKHLESRLDSVGIKAEPVVSSTITRSEIKITDGQLKNKECIKLVTVSYLRVEKNISDQLVILRAIVEQGFNVHLDIVGNGPEHDTLVNKAIELGVLKHLTFHGHIDCRDKLFSLLDQSDFFLLTSKSEGSPRVVIEAAARGLSIISYRVGALPYSFSDTEICFVNDINDAKDRIICIFNDHNSSFAIEAQKKVYNGYTIEPFLNRVFSCE